MSNIHSLTNCVVYTGLDPRLNPVNLRSRRNFFFFFNFPNTADTAEDDNSHLLDFTSKHRGPAYSARNRWKPNLVDAVSHDERRGSRTDEQLEWHGGVPLCFQFAHPAAWRFPKRAERAHKRQLPPPSPSGSRAPLPKLPLLNAGSCSFLIERRKGFCGNGTGVS